MDDHSSDGRSQINKSFFSCSPVIMLLQVQTPGTFELVYPNSRENGIRVQGDRMGIPKAFRKPVRLGWLYFDFFFQIGLAIRLHREIRASALPENFGKIWIDFDF